LRENEEADTVEVDDASSRWLAVSPRSIEEVLHLLDEVD